jgi:hypothetical protein
MEISLRARLQATGRKGVFSSTKQTNSLCLSTGFRLCLHTQNDLLQTVSLQCPRALLRANRGLMTRAHFHFWGNLSRPINLVVRPLFTLTLHTAPTSPATLLHLCRQASRRPKCTARRFGCRNPPTTECMSAALDAQQNFRVCNVVVTWEIILAMAHGGFGMFHQFYSGRSSNALPPRPDDLPPLPPQFPNFEREYLGTPTVLYIKCPKIRKGSLVRRPRAQDRSRFSN